MTVYIKSLASHLKKKESPFVWVVSIKQITRMYQIQGYFGYYTVFDHTYSKLKEMLSSHSYATKCNKT